MAALYKKSGVSAEEHAFSALTRNWPSWIFFGQRDPVGNFRADRERTHANKKCPNGPNSPLKLSYNEPKCRAMRWGPTWRKRIWKWSPDELGIAPSTFGLLHVLQAPNSEMVKMFYYPPLFIVKNPKLPYFVGFFAIFSHEASPDFCSEHDLMCFYVYQMDFMRIVPLCRYRCSSMVVTNHMSSLSSFPTLNKRR